MRILSVMVVVAACGGGTPAPKFPTPVDADNQVRALEGEWMHAEAKRDPSALQFMLDDHFTATFGGTAPLEKASFISEVVKMPDGMTQTLSDQKVTVDGDVAVITGIDTIAAPGQPGHAVRYTATYVYRDGHWRAFAEHLAPVPTPQPAAPATPPATPDTTAAPAPQ
jgi:uncharacterized protein (TIGR02246 family)